MSGKTGSEARWELQEVVFGGGDDWGVGIHRARSREAGRSVLRLKGVCAQQGLIIANAANLGKGRRGTADWMT